MKYIKFAILVMFILHPLFLPGQEEYNDMANAMNKLLTAQKTYIVSLESARKSEEISLAMKEFEKNLKELAPVFTSLNERYPKLLASRSKMPSELIETIDASELINKRLTQITLLSLYRYGSEPNVVASMTELKSAIISLETKHSR